MRLCVRVLCAWVCVRVCAYELCVCVCVCVWACVCACVCVCVCISYDPHIQQPLFTYIAKLLVSVIERDVFSVM